LLAPTIDKTPPEQRQTFAVWFEHILLRLIKTSEQEQKVKEMVADIQRKGMSAVISNLELNLEWIQEQAAIKGMEKGIKEGIEKGIEPGLEKGLEKGIEKGREEGLEKVALNMLHKQMEIDLVVELTGLSRQKILELQQRIR
jgi:flagellar biosynthesis/type III secretory pathway protein FliH